MNKIVYIAKLGLGYKRYFEMSEAKKFTGPGFEGKAGEKGVGKHEGTVEQKYGLVKGKQEENLAKQTNPKEENKQGATVEKKGVISPPGAGLTGVQKEPKFDEFKKEAREEASTKEARTKAQTEQLRGKPFAEEKMVKEQKGKKEEIAKEPMIKEPYVKEPTAKATGAKDTWAKDTGAKDIGAKDIGEHNKDKPFTNEPLLGEPNIKSGNKEGNVEGLKEGQQAAKKSGPVNIMLPE